MRLRRDLEHKVLLVILVILFVGSVVTAIENVEARWQVPLILLALIAIIRLVTPVEEIHTDVQYLKSLSTSAKVNPYPSLEAFYADLRHALSQAKYTLDLTHIRDNPPADFGDHASGWFDAVVDWLEADPARSVRRLIAIRNEAMHEWAQELERVSDRLPRLEVRVVTWNIDAPAINVAIIDGNVVFLAVTGEMLERTRGIAVEDPGVAHYFSDYYNNVWHCADSLSSYLAKRKGGEDQPARVITDGSANGPRKGTESAPSAPFDRF